MQSYTALKSQCKSLEDQLRNLRMGASFHLSTILQSCPREQLEPLSSLLSILDQSSHLKQAGDTLLVPIPLEEMRSFGEKSEIWYSPPFYIGEGYKMCVGTRPAASTTEGYAMVFLFLLPGEFDHQLPWPPQGLDKMDIEIVVDLCGTDVQLTKSMHIPLSTLNLREKVGFEVRKVLYKDEQFWSQSLRSILASSSHDTSVTAAYRLSLVPTTI